MTNDEPGEQLFVVYESDLREMGPGDAWPTDSDTWTVVRLAQKTQGASRDASSDDPNKVNCFICGKLWGEHSSQEQADCSAAL